MSDKTGTLTQNVMAFVKCSVGGRVYSADDGIDGAVHPGFVDLNLRDGESGVLLDGSSEGCAAAKTHTLAKSSALRAAASARDANVVAFLRHLATCHTVVPAVGRSSKQFIRRVDRGGRRKLRRRLRRPPIPGIIPRRRGTRHRRRVTRPAVAVQRRGRDHVRDAPARRVHRSPRHRRPRKRRRRRGGMSGSNDARSSRSTSSRPRVSGCPSWSATFTPACARCC